MPPKPQQVDQAAPGVGQSGVAEDGDGDGDCGLGTAVGGILYLGLGRGRSSALAALIELQCPTSLALLHVPHQINNKNLLGCCCCASGSVAVAVAIAVVAAEKKGKNQ